MVIPYEITAFAEELARYPIPFIPTIQSRVLVNDIQLILNADYVIEGNVIVFNPALNIGDQVQVFQF